MDLRLTVLDPRQIDRRAWDELCARADASFRCLSGSFVFPSLADTRCVEFHVDNPTRRIAQCAVRISNDQATFLDSLVIDPQFREHSARCLERVLQQLGKPGMVFRYGSPWNMQSASIPIATDLGGIEILQSEEYAVDAVDLTQYGSPEQLFRALNGSHKRNVRRAEALGNDLCLSVYRGPACLRHLFTMNSLRRQTYARKGLSFCAARSLLAMVYKSLAYGQSAFLSLIKSGRQTFGGVFGISHPSVCHYLHGGNIPNRLGLSHYQHWAIIEECFRRGQRFYVMGYAYERENGSAALENQRSFKKRFRTEEYAGQVLKLRLAA